MDIHVKRNERILSVWAQDERLKFHVKVMRDPLDNRLFAKFIFAGGGFRSSGGGVYIPDTEGKGVDEIDPTSVLDAIMEHGALDEEKREFLRKLSEKIDQRRKRTLKN